MGEVIGGNWGQILMALPYAVTVRAELVEALPSPSTSPGRTGDFGRGKR